MRITTRTHSALALLNPTYWKHNNVAIHADDYAEYIKKYNYLSSIFSENKSHFNTKITYVSEPFYDAAQIARDSLIKMFDSDSIDILVQGIYILSKRVIYVNMHSTPQNDGHCTYIEFDCSFKDKAPVLVACFSGSFNKLGSYHLAPHYIEKGEAKNMNVVDSLIVDILILAMFKKYAKVETKYLKPHSRVRDIKCKYINDTNYNILHLDSKWFTTLVKSDGFKVRGHFRLQPKKDKNGKWIKELIWISDFEKLGYTSKARKLAFID